MRRSMRFFSPATPQLTGSITFHIWPTTKTVGKPGSGDTGHVAVTAQSTQQQAYLSLWPDTGAINSGFRIGKSINEHPAANLMQMKKFIEEQIDRKIAENQNNRVISSKLSLIKKVLENSDELTPVVMQIINRAQGIELNLWSHNHKQELIPYNAGLDLSIIQPPNFDNQHKRVDVLVTETYPFFATLTHGNQAVEYDLKSIEFEGYDPDKLPKPSDLISKPILAVRKELADNEAITGVPAKSMPNVDADAYEYGKNPDNYTFSVTNQTAEQVVREIQSLVREIEKEKVRYALHPIPGYFSCRPTETHLHCLSSSLLVTKPLIPELRDWSTLYKQSATTTPSQFAKELSKIPGVTVSENNSTEEKRPAPKT